MFVGEKNILELIELLQSRRISLYHACQLKDLLSYVQVGGIPARGLLKDLNLPFTGFKSDGNDQKSDDWNRVFLNLNDFGNFFHSGSNSTPNVYGPIVLKLDPDCIEDAEDVAVCLCSAGSEGYDRAQFSLKNVQEVDQLFSYPREDQYRSFWLKKTSELKSTFAKIPVRGSPELSCTVKARLLKLDYLTRVIVDPLKFQNHDLVESVKDLLASHHEILESMVKRSTKHGKRYDALIDAVGAGFNDLTQLSSNHVLRDWANAVIANDLAWQFERFATYLREGTLDVLQTKKPAA